MPFQVTLMLADSAQAVENKLYVLGGGWSQAGPDPFPSAIALHIKVPWDQANITHTLTLELVDSDGNAFTVPGTDGAEPLVVRSEFEVGRPPGTTPGTSIDLSFALNIGPLPLPPGRRYEWRLSIGEESHENWRLPFSVRPAPVGWHMPPGFGAPPVA
jgi:hypothetical protein